MMQRRRQLDAEIDSMQKRVQEELEEEMDVGIRVNPAIQAMWATDPATSGTDAAGAAPPADDDGTGLGDLDMLENELLAATSAAAGAMAGEDVEILDPRLDFLIAERLGRRRVMSVRTTRRRLQCAKSKVYVQCSRDSAVV
jgi:hypothetical protein